MAQSEHNPPISQGGGAAVSPSATVSHATPAVTPRCQPPIPIPAKCPCEERIDGKLCRQESDSMTALGKLLCKTHREAQETKFHIVINRLAMMLP